MKLIKQQHLEILRHGSAVKNKIRLLNHTLRLEQDDKALLAILTIANAQRWTSDKLRKLRESLHIIEGNQVSSDIDVLLSKVIRGDLPDSITSEATFEILTFLLSPLSFGITIDSLFNLLKSYPMSLGEAYRELNLVIHEDTDTVEEVKPCGVCGRIMKSTKNTSGVCSSCLSLAYHYTIFRRGTFDVPLNIWNFTKFDGLNNTEVSFNILDYKVSKENDSLIFTPNPEYTGYLNLPLPIEEFAVKIYRI